MRSGLPRDEAGFTLPEVLVSMVVMATVLFALYAVFDASVRVFGAGRDRLEGTQNARLVLARMERELRAAYPMDRGSGDVALLESFGEDHVTFGNDLDGDRRTRDPATGAWDARERISFTLDDDGTPLRNGVPLAEFTADGDGQVLSFEYFDADGDPVTGGEESEVALVRISLKVSVGRGAGGGSQERVLRTSVALRNR